MTPTPLGPGSEFDLIRRFLQRSRAAGADVRIGPGDDCAILAGGIALSVDLSVEDVHFRRDWLEFEEIGLRAAAASFSDLAAVAAEPIGALVSLAAPPNDVPAAAERCMAGVRELVEDEGGALLGGDVVRSPGPLVLDIVAVGRAAEPVLRGGARPGDEIWVTGSLGGAAAAVRCWQDDTTPPAAARRAFAHPRPRLREARWLADRGVLHALIDLSDGLAGDAAHLAAASGVEIALDGGAVPVHEGARAVARGDAALALALGGGEDYELCLAAPAGAVERIAASFRDRFGVPLTRVGTVRAGAGVVLVRPDGSIESVDGAGFRHFAREDG